MVESRNIIFNGCLPPFSPPMEVLALSILPLSALLSYSKLLLCPWIFWYRFVLYVRTLNPGEAMLGLPPM